jgi:pimeloyl-ACP methyl ester carboxylesterase
VHDPVASLTRACSYSRAGILPSDPASGERDANAVAEDLHTLLDRAGERPPLVFVAHSLGGLYALTYTQRFGSEVAGLVLVDTLHPDSIRRVEAAGIHIPLPLRELQIACMLSWTGLVRLMLGPADEEAGYEIASLPGMRGELEALERSQAQAGAIRQLGNRPTYALSAGQVEPGLLVEAQLTAEQGDQFLTLKRSMNEEQASWSTQGRHEVVADAMHAIQWQQPDRVIGAARWVIEAVRADTAR